MQYRVFLCASLVAGTMFAFVPACFGQARLIVDTDTTPVVTSSDVMTGGDGPIARLGRSLVFGVQTSEYTKSLVTLDPVTRARSVVIPELIGVASWSFGLANFGRDRVLFSVRPKNDPELVVTDGTPAGTTVLRQLGSYDFAPVVTVGKRALFTDYDVATGTELYVTDGTPNGTKLLVDLYPGSASGSPSFLGVEPTGAYAVVRARVADTVIHLLRTDGTTTGTVVIAALDVMPTPIAWLDSSRFVFSARERTGIEPWISDGTAAGTHRLADLQVGGSSSPASFVRYGTRVLFQASPSVTTRTLYATDGTNLVALRTRTNYSGTMSFFEEPTACDGKLYFRSNDPVSGDELFVTDGTASGTRMVADLEPGSASSSPKQLTASGKALYFTASGPSSAGLHIVRGAAPTIRRVPFDIDIPRNLTAVDIESIAFVATDPRFGVDIYTSDGTAIGTARHDYYDKPGATVGGNPAVFASTGLRAVFLANNPNQKLWSVDGSEGGASVLASTAPRGIESLISIGARALYVIKIAPYTFELWSTDGTASGTKMAMTLFNTSSFEPIGHGRAYYLSPSLGITDGTPQGTRPLPPYSGSFGFTAVSRENDDGVFAMAMHYGFWISDGSPTGTRKKFQMIDELGIRAVKEIVPLRNGWFFTAETAAAGLEPWFTDGSESGTFLLRDIHPGQYGSQIDGVCVQDGRVWFAATDYIHGFELWVSDGTRAGTHLVVDAIPGFASSYPHMLTPVGTHTVYYSAYMEGVGYELHRIDTRTNAFELAADINPGPDSGVMPHYWGAMDEAVVVGSDVIFNADDGLHGPEPYAFRHGAVATKFGRACGMGSLECDLDPQLGSAVTWRFSSRGKGRGHHVLLVGTPDFEGVPLGNGCLLNIDPTGVIPTVTHGTEAWSTTVPVPNDPSLVDVTVAWQVLSLDLATHRYASSNAVQWTLGR
ncbi:MAG: hypothetical protein KDC95_05605 [Planctomycetes bacterium]|nr:hypothetical protein [Planctomycetota bacterium]